MSKKKPVSKILTEAKPKTIREMRRYLVGYLEAYGCYDLILRMPDSEVTELYNKIHGGKA